MQIYEECEKIEKKRIENTMIYGHGHGHATHMYYTPNPSNFLFNFEIQNTFFNFDVCNRNSYMLQSHGPLCVFLWCFCYTLDTVRSSLYLSCVCVYVLCYLFVIRLFHRKLNQVKNERIELPQKVCLQGMAMKWKREWILMKCFLCDRL